MFKTIEKLRGKPDGTKKKVALLVAFIFTLIIFLVWLTVVYPDLRSEKAQGDRVKNLEKSPTSTFTENFNSGVSSIGEEFSKIKEAISSFSTSPEHYSATSTAGSENTVGTTTTSAPVSSSTQP